MVGFAEPVPGGGDHRHAYNSLAVLADGAVQRVYRKNRLPNYSVFDEQRYFVPGTDGEVIAIAGSEVGSDDLRGRLGAGAARTGRGRGGRDIRRQSLRLALPPRQGPRARRDVRRAGA